MNNPTYYAIIPAFVRYADITPNAKLLYGEITALCNKNGYCYASNNYFANLYNVSKNSIVSWVSELVEHKFISREIIAKSDNSGIVCRYLRILPDPIQENLDPIQENLEGYPKKLGGVSKKTGWGIQKNLYNNNTLNITSNNTLNNPGNSNKNNKNIIEEINKIEPPKISAPTLPAGAQLPVKVKALLIDQPDIAKKALTDYCLFLIDAYDFKDRALCNRVDEIKRKARNTNIGIEAICSYNINGNYKNLYLPSNLAKTITQECAISEQATEQDFVKDKNGNIEEIW